MPIGSRQLSASFEGYVFVLLPSDSRMKVKRSKRHSQNTTCLGASATAASIIRTARKDDECVMRQQTDSQTTERSEKEAKCLGGFRAAVFDVGRWTPVRNFVISFSFCESVHHNERDIAQQDPAVHCRPLAMDAFGFLLEDSLIAAYNQTPLDASCAIRLQIYLHALLWSWANTGYV